ncbi:MAG: hemerythrin domain-containing protein, partial [Pseudohongiellaceae bacterium]
MSIYKRIKADHDFHRELLDKLENTEGDSDTRRQQWYRFFYDVKAHAAAEEETLYAKLIATEAGQPDARHSIHEHQKLDKIMDELN